MSYTLSWWEKVDKDWVGFSREITEQEYQEALTTKTVTGFKEGSIVMNVQLTEKLDVQPFTKTKPKENKPYYRKEQW